MNKRAQSLLFFLFFVLACVVYTATDEENSKTENFTNSNPELIQKNPLADIS